MVLLFYTTMEVYTILGIVPRKRHIVVDVLGCLLSVVVHTANIHDTKGGISTARQAYERYPSIQRLCADAGYRVTFVSDVKK